MEDGFRLKVLWFSNTPANADDFLNTQLKGSGGWLKSLDQFMQEYVDLHIVFYSEEDTVFKYKNSTYYSLKRNKSLFDKLRRRIFGYISWDNDLSKYLLIINYLKPDVVHVHGTENSFGLVANRISVPLVVSIQGLVNIITHKYFSGFSREYLRISDRKYTSVRKFLFPQNFRDSLIFLSNLRKKELRVLNSVCYLIGRTEWDRRISSILSPNSIYFHNDEILRGLFYPSVWSPPENVKFVIFTTNGNSFYKGFETLCECLYLLLQRGLQIEWRVAGISDSDLIVKVTKRKLQERFPKSGLVLLGNLNEENLVSEMLVSNLYVMPSHIENSPNSLSEAMLLGMPCIATFVGGVGSLITDKIDGLLIQSGDPWVMSGSILELLNNVDYCVELGRNARNRALRRHNGTQIAEELLAIYKSVIEDYNRKLI